MRSKWAIEKATKFSMFLPQTGRGKRHLLHHIHEWDDHWKAMNPSFKEGLNVNEIL